VELAFALVAGAVGWSVGCSGSANFALLDGGASLPGTDGAAAGTCTPCVTSANCGAGICAQFQGDIFCAASCASSEGLGACPAGTTCSLETSFSGAQVSVCVPDNNLCGAPVGPGSSGSGSGGGTTTCVPAGAGNCSGYAAPDTTASCHGCESSSSTCSSNGCYGGWYCDTATSKCHAPPTGCSSGGAPTCTGTGVGTGSIDAGLPTSPVTGTVGAAGGSVSRLFFAVVGDTRPASEDDTSGYPTTIIEKIFTDVAALTPQPSFIVSTGDYQFASTTGSESLPQIELYLSARAKFPGVQFPAMGNHECNGYTASNCGSGNTDGVTPNYTNFMSKLLSGISTSPYYAIKVNATDGSWTSKFVFIAANAWDSTQESWLDSTLATSTTYTFVIRHEANEASTAPGTTPSEAIVTKHPLTLEICGHTHTYSHSGNRIVFGNGGAPMTGSGDFGFGTIQQRSDGAIVVDDVDYQTGAADPSFHFVVTPTGTETQ
jgi:hypothetical protein